MSAISSFRFSFALAISVALIAPAGAGLFGPSTPQEKLSDAYELAGRSGRIAEARRLIEEARADCEAKSDKACLAEVNRLYGLLERAGAFKDVILMFGGIYAKMPTPENIDRARPYFDEAILLATEAGDFGQVAHINYELAVSEKVRGTPQAGCIYIDRMLVAYQEGLKRDPNARMHMPPQFKTADEWVAGMKTELGCPVK